MRIYVGSLVEGIISDYYFETIERLSKEGLIDMKVKIRTPHITLKAPFETKEVDKLEEIILDSFPENPRMYLTIGRFGNFVESEKPVLFIDVEASYEFLRHYKKFLDSLSRANFPFSEYDRVDKNFHITLAKGNEIPDIDKALSYLQKNQNRLFNTSLANITIFKKGRSETKVIRNYDTI